MFLLLKPATAFLIVASLSLFYFFFPVNAIRTFPSVESDDFEQFSEAPEYQNAPQCSILSKNDVLLVCDPSVVHIAMTLDPKYFRGTVAAVNSVLRHSTCPENVFFHFIASDSSPVNPNQLTLLQSVFPSLNSKVYVFREDIVTDLISSSIRPALDNPLNYARTYLAEMLESCVRRVVYLDSDVVVVDDIENLWKISLTGSRTIGAPEYCHVNFTKYFTNEFWFNRGLTTVFEGKRPCYFNTGVMVMDLERWRQGDYTRKIEKWMRIQKEKRIYQLGSLPPFLLVFGGDVEGIDHRWNQHGLGGDNLVNSCRSLHPGPVSLLHWSGKGKPWNRLDENKPCPVDHLWAPYDLYKFQKHHQQQ